jgi:hypothetical protein
LASSLSAIYQSLQPRHPARPSSARSPSTAVCSWWWSTLPAFHSLSAAIQDQVCSLNGFKRGPCIF